MNRVEQGIRIALTVREQDKQVAAGVIYAAIGRLNRESRTLHRLAELDCNEGLNELGQKQVRRCLKRAQAAAYLLGGTVEHKTDPRAGCGLVLTIRVAEFCMADARGN